MHVRNDCEDCDIASVWDLENHDEISTVWCTNMMYVGIGCRYRYLCPMVVFFFFLFFFYSLYSRRPTMTIKAEGRTVSRRTFLPEKRPHHTHTHMMTRRWPQSLLQEETLTLRVHIIYVYYDFTYHVFTSTPAVI